MTNRLAIDIKCRKYKGCHKKVDLEEKLHHDVEIVTDFSYLGDRTNSGCEVAATTRTRLGWVEFRECQDLPCRKKFPLKIKGSAYKRCVRSPMPMEAIHGA